MAGTARGFGRLPLEERTALASKGGLAAHAGGRAHEWTSDEARAAGRKGGRAPKPKKKKTPAATKARGGGGGA